MTLLDSRPAALRQARALLPPLGAALIALLSSQVAPLLSPLLIAMAIGAAIVNSPLHRVAWLTADAATTTKLLLRLGVVMVGLRLPVGDVVAIGLPGLAVIVCTLAGTYWLTRRIGTRLDLDPRFVSVLAAGFSVCGAAAIATVSDAVRARQRDVALAVALVTIYGSAMIVILPGLAGLIGLSRHQAGIWAGASVHEVAQVAVTASLVGGSALAVAMTVKLGRVALLAPLYVVIARGTDKHSDSGPDRTRVPILPWFVIGFAVAVAVRGAVPLSDTVLNAANQATTLLLGAGMFGLGVGLKLKDLWPIPPAALLLATASTLVAAGISLTLILVLL